MSAISGEQKTKPCESQGGRASLVARLKPLESSPHEIRPLDGLRAVAALLIVLFHFLHEADFQHSAASHYLGNFFWYLPTGVHLFFVLSGFLLFMPYARAILLDRPLPGIWRFFQRRALRILPAYLVAVVILALLPTADHTTHLPAASVAAHFVFIHDMFPPFNRDLEGPFWTLAVEVQFYLLLPFIAAGLAWFVRGSRSTGRLMAGIGLCVVLTLTLRAIDIHIVNVLPATTDVTHSPAGIFVLVTMGVQGKYLEVFLMGMLASVIYIVSVERGGIARLRRERLAWGVLWASVVTVLAAIPFIRYGGTIFAPGETWNFPVLIYPLVVGVGYATLLLAILWGNRAIRWFFESPPLRFIGLISFSLYLWHDPSILGMIPFVAALPLVVRVLAAFIIAYLSYQLIERPFLNRRRRTEQPGGARDAAKTLAAAQAQDVASARA